MIFKKRDDPFYLLQLQALEGRLPINHPRADEVRDDRINEMTGLKGEKQIDFPLSFLCPKEYQILHQVRLPDEQGFFQIDCLILHKNFVLILEVKNWFGTIVFGPKGQVIRVTEKEQKDGFPSPIQQVKLQKHRLKNWLETHGFPEIPLHSYIVIADTRTIIKQMAPQIKIPNNIIYSNELFFEIDNIKNGFTSEHYSQNQLNKLAKILKNSHTINQVDILKKYEIPRVDIIPGVACPSCSKYSMIKKRHKPWLCRYCQEESRNAHVSALNDYFLLISSKVTNKQIREFLFIESPYIMKYILRKKQYRYYGNTKGRFYKLTIK